jgi:DNA-binding HxlR family transcriptional regulator
VAERWTPLILRELLMGTRRFGDFQKAIPLISPGILSGRLASLEDAGIVEKRPAPSDARGREYHLTESGEELRPIILELGRWGIRWLRRKANLQEHDAAALMWDMKRRVDLGGRSEAPLVIHFELRGVAERVRFWWLLVDHEDRVDLCMTPPGHEVALSVVASLETLADVWLGERDIKSAVACGDVLLDGDRELADSIDEWIGLSPLTQPD